MSLADLCYCLWTFRQYNRFVMMKFQIIQYRRTQDGESIKKNLKAESFETIEKHIYAYHSIKIQKISK